MIHGAPGIFSLILTDIRLVLPANHMGTYPDIFRLVDWLWIGTLAVWAVSAVVARQTIGSHSDWQSRVAVWVVGLSWWLLLDRRIPGVLAFRFVPASQVVVYSGLALTLAGLGLAFWGRFHLGGNWAVHVELKRDHQLIRSGPYSIVRHPIYSGFMLASLGTALVFGELHELLAFTLILTAWGYKSRLEEAFLVKQFGAEYEEYRKQVKGLIPFVW
jgi:protein-S-isoprenylcysteine O-methyltransferase Ste14